MLVLVCQLLYYTDVLLKVLYCKIKEVLFIFCYFLFCENHYKLITVQGYIADYISWVPKITLWDLWTNWIYKFALRMELFVCRGLAVSWICTHLAVAGFDSVLVCWWFLTLIVCLPLLLIFRICDTSVSSHGLSCLESFRNCCKAVVMSDCLNFTCLCSFLISLLNLKKSQVY